MSHNASDAQKLISVNNVTVVPAVNTPFLVTKGYTASSPATGGIRYFQLPDPTTVVVGMSYEIKDSNGTAGASAHKIVVMAPGSVQIDGSTDNDEITTAWGAKTYVNMGNHYSVRGIQRHRAATPSGGGAYDQSFPGSDEDPLPADWSASSTGTWPSGTSGWLIQSDTFSNTGPNLSSVGNEYDGAYGNYIFSSDATSTLTYNAGTLTAGDVVTFKWMKDSAYSNTYGYTFKINGVTENTMAHSDMGTWKSISYTVPSTGTYVLSWEWYMYPHPSYRQASAASNNGCFVDEFTIT